MKSTHKISIEEIENFSGTIDVAMSTKEEKRFFIFVNVSTKLYVVTHKGKEVFSDADYGLAVEKYNSIK